MFIILDFKAKLYDDTAKQIPLHAAGDEVSPVSVTNMTKFSSGRASCGNSVQKSLSLGDVSVVRGFTIRADYDFTLRLNGGAETLSILRSAAGKPAQVALEATVTQIQVTAPAAGVGVPTSVNFIYDIWGDVA